MVCHTMLNPRVAVSVLDELEKKLNSLCDRGKSPTTALVLLRVNACILV